jgi:hypothetical protein
MGIRKHGEEQRRGKPRRHQEKYKKTIERSKDKRLTWGGGFGTRIPRKGGKLSAD